MVLVWSEIDRFWSVDLRSKSLTINNLFFQAKRMKKDSANKQTQLLKLHRTTLRVIQVAASRPILRILNPHIYSDLGGLIRELSNISNDITTLPKWESDIILEALDQAILFPSRKNSKKSLINPQGRFSRKISKFRLTKTLKKNYKRLCWSTCPKKNRST